MPGLMARVMLFCYLLLVPSNLFAQVTLHRIGTRVDVQIDAQPFTSFHFGSDWPKPFLHPLRSSSGQIVTRHYPMGQRLGESEDHIWHRGLWFGHGDIQGVDFWREKSHKKTRYPLPIGRIVFRRLPTLKNGNDTGEVSGEFDLISPQGILGSLILHFQFHRLGPHNTVDCWITLVADAGQCLKLGDTEEGTFAVRVAPELRQDRGGSLRNAEGLVGTEQIWGKPSPWVDYSAQIKGKSVGIAIFDHPSNPRHPTHWHARGYGLFSANPFGEHDFYGDPERDGGLTIPAGKQLQFRYRVIVHQGNAASASVESLYSNYARTD